MILEIIGLLFLALAFYGYICMCYGSPSLYDIPSDKQFQFWNKVGKVLLIVGLAVAIGCAVLIYFS